MTARCPTCGQEVRHRGRSIVRWPPLKQEIFIAIASRGDVGASSEEIINEVYVGRRRPSLETVKAHVWQMNEVLETEAPGVRIVSHGGRWVLCRETVLTLWRAGARETEVPAVRVMRAGRLRR